MINVCEVSKRFGDTEVLKGISLDVDKGEVVCLIGPSGSGKSTLLLCINGIEKIDSGRILVDGTHVHSRSTNLNELRQKIGIVFQQYNVFPHLTALQNVELALRVVKKLSRGDARELAMSQLGRVGLEKKASSLPRTLSGGQQQRLAIARALAMAPEYMLFDEITSALDPELVGEVLDTLRMLSEDGMTMLIVTHEIHFAREVAHRVAFFDDGVVAGMGSPKELFENPSTERMHQFLRKVL